MLVLVFFSSRMRKHSVYRIQRIPTRPFQWNGKLSSKHFGMQSHRHKSQLHQPLFDAQLEDGTRVRKFYYIVTKNCATHDAWIGRISTKKKIRTISSDAGDPSSPECIEHKSFNWNQPAAYNFIIRMLNKTTPSSCQDKWHSGPLICALVLVGCTVVDVVWSDPLSAASLFVDLSMIELHS